MHAIPHKCTHVEQWPLCITPTPWCEKADKKSRNIEILNHSFWFHKLILPYSSIRTVEAWHHVLKVQDIKRLIEQKLEQKWHFKRNLRLFLNMKKYFWNTRCKKFYAIHGYWIPISVKNRRYVPLKKRAQKM